MEPTIRRALRRGPGPAAGAQPGPPAPPTSGTHPPKGRRGREAALRAPRWRPPARGGEGLVPGRPWVPSLKRWGGPRPGELAPRAAPGWAEVGAGERGVLGEGAPEGSGHGAPGEGQPAGAPEWSSCLAGSFTRGEEMAAGSWAGAPRASLPTPSPRPLWLPQPACPPPKEHPIHPETGQPRSVLPSYLKPGMRPRRRGGLGQVPSF